MADVLNDTMDNWEEPELKTESKRNSQKKGQIDRIEIVLVGTGTRKARRMARPSGVSDSSTYLG